MHTEHVLSAYRDNAVMEDYNRWKILSATRSIITEENQYFDEGGNPPNHQRRIPPPGAQLIRYGQGSLGGKT